MSPRTRLALILGVTIFAIAGAVGYMVERARQWHQRGWAGVVFLAGPSAEQQARLMGLKEGAVITTFAGSPADGKMLNGDVILSISGVPLKDQKRLVELDRRLALGDLVTYRVLRNGKEIDVPLRFDSPLRSRQIIVVHVVSLAVGLTFIAIGLLIIVRAQKDARATVFYVLSLLSAVALIGRTATVYEQSGGRGIVIDPFSTLIAAAFFVILSLMYLPMILHLALIFPRPRPLIVERPYILRWIYAAAMLSTAAVIFFVSVALLGADTKPGRNELLDAIFEPIGYALLAFSLIVAVHLLYAARREGAKHAVLTRPFRVSLAAVGVLGAFAKVAGKLGLKIVGAVLGIGAVALPFLVMLSFPFFAIVALYRSYRTANVEEKRQLAWPMWGLLITVAGKIVSLALISGLGMWLTLTHRSLIAWRGPLEVLGTIPTLLTLAIPISFAIAILKYRLMNIDVIIKKTVVYAILSGIIVVIYLGVVGILGALLVQYAGVRNQITVIGATLVVAAAFVPMRNKLQTLVERNLFRHKFAYPDAVKAVASEALVAHDAGAFLASAAEKMQQALQNRNVVIFTARHDELIASAKLGVADSVLGALRIARAPLLRLLDRPFDPRTQSLPDDAAAALKRVESVLVVPINTPGTPTNGFIAVAAKLSGGEYDEDDIQFLRSMADQLDIGLDRIRLQREDADYSQARTIQQGLLPREMPRIAGLDVSGVWQPARAMGGDYFDVLELSATELALCIGDVAGKGMPAALLMSGLQAAVRASASSSPRDLCERVRRVVTSSLTGGRFVTFFYATLDTAAMRLRWTNAGHNPPILARADGTVVRLEEGGPALSRLFRTPYEEREIALLPGDRLVLFTDGVSEASMRGGEMFGEERIEQLVVDTPIASAEELQQLIVNAATTFAGGEVEDDLTLVVAKIA